MQIGWKNILLKLQKTKLIRDKIAIMHYVKLLKIFYKNINFCILIYKYQMDA